MSVLQRVPLGQYVPGDSYLHRLDPRTKVIASLFLMTCFLLSNEVLVQLVLFSLCIGTVLLSRLPMGVLLRGMKFVLWIFAFTFIIHALFTPGEPLLRLPFSGLVVSGQGLLNGLLFGFRIMLLFFMAEMLTLTTSPIELADALEVLGGPLRKLKLPVQEFALMLNLSMRFIPTLFTEAHRIRIAQMSRGVEFQGPIITRIKNTVPMLVPLFVAAIRRAEELAQAMEARGYMVGATRTRFRQYSFGTRDYQVFLVTAAVAGGVVFMHL